MIVHVDQNDEPVLLEIFNGNQYLKELGKSLSKDVKPQVLAQSHSVTTHQIKR